MLWDIFCRVIDNFGDIGVCWRLGADLASRGHSVRLWVDDSQALQWMAPSALNGTCLGVQVLPWEHSGHAKTLHALPSADVWIEAFGCDIPLAFVAHFAHRLQPAGLVPGPATEPSLEPSAIKPPVWINLEYLSAEPYVERCHGLPSPVMRGPAKGWTKFFFYPGFSAKTGGLLREQALPAEWRPPEASTRSEFFAKLGIDWQGERVLSLFCYEPPLLQALLDDLAGATTPVYLLVTAGRASTAVRALAGVQTAFGSLRLHYLPLLSQTNYDRLLASCDVNFVRGEDSVVRALWAGQPFVWHIYPQEDQAHAAKLEAFLEQMQFSVAVRHLHRAWNGLLTMPAEAAALLPLHPGASEQWQREVHASRQRAFKLPDLSSSLLQFVLENR